MDFLTNVTADMITDKFCEDNPNLWAHQFLNGEARKAYHDIMNVKREELTEKFVDYLNRTEADRKIKYRDMVKQFGNKTAPKGRGLWGAINSVDHNGSGIRIISCTGHGGAIVSHAQEKTIDEPLRKSYEYEEDCDLDIIMAYNPRIAVKYNRGYYGDNIMEARRKAVENLVNGYNYTFIRKIVG